jgi:alpha-tubulin suppressor-like RCC1 family protein
MRIPGAVGGPAFGLVLVVVASCRDLGDVSSAMDAAANGPTAGCASSVCPLLARKIAAGPSHGCAVLIDGSVACWGRNDLGQLGDGSMRDASRPVRVAGLSGAIDISVHDQSCALLVDGTFRCWGQLTGGARSATPVTVNGLRGVTAIANRGRHTCALVAGGSVWCWGTNADGQLGDDSTTDSAVPVRVADVTGATAIAAGERHSCALVGGGGELHCWGALGDLVATPAPVRVGPSRIGASAIGSGSRHVCLIVDTAVKCLGDNSAGQLGPPLPPWVPMPIAVTDRVGAVALAMNDDGACALRGVEQLICWGRIVASPIPVRVFEGDGVRAAAIGGGHFCIILAGGAVRCWGQNRYGQLGDGTTEDSALPRAVLAP